ncbi:MAG: 1-acyl-sn-glycerol-3-phosphate acyltransferase [Deltaproteobacteria bacterium]|nr:1-acyl-sn-glycerol-3-phosphate acyltransferase [Deltaproteobacteria bacterium]
MTLKSFPTCRVGHLIDRLIDCTVTVACWSWFIFGFLLFFSWFYIAFSLFSKNPEIHFQKLNSLFYRFFFRILKLTAPRQKIEIDERAAAIKSSVIVCNHLSYLDPLLLIALFPKQKTIVKTRFFGAPVFGWIIAKSGYLPATGEGRFSRMMIEQMETMATYLKAGGNLFVFPEGTRVRDGRICEFHMGALKIARMHQAPVHVLQIRNSDKLFTPGRFLFNTRIKNTISVKSIDCIEPDYKNNPPSTAQLARRVRQSFYERQI